MEKADVLSSNASIDLQTHTNLSDGVWTPAQLIDYFVSEGFALAAITDHDRVDTAGMLQKLAQQKGFALLVAAEMTTTWRGEMTDVLCFGFDLGENPLYKLTQDVLQRQCENSREVYENLYKAGYLPEHDDAELSAVLATPGAQQVNELLRLVVHHSTGKKNASPVQIITEAGFFFATSDIAEVVQAAHESGGLALIAHPGRGGEFIRFDSALLDQLHREVPIDGLEVYYPRHSPEQIAFFQAYTDEHDLLVSCGSDSHTPEKPPIKYRAELSRKLLDRLGIKMGP